MMNSRKAATTMLSIAVLMAGLTGCQKTESASDEKGPAEKAGKQIDQAAAKASEQLNKMAEEAGKGLAKAGEKLQKKAEDAQKKE
jgi:hypothetical protein